MRVAFHTLGCRLNQFETESMSERVRTRLDRARVVGWDAGADVYVINSCAVTARAEQKCRQLARSIKRDRPEARVVITGCYPQLEGEKLADLAEIDAVLGNEEKRQLEVHLPRILDDETTLLAVAPFRRGQAMAEEWIDAFGTHSRATLKVQEGCDMRCAFCAIWKARGPSRSRPPRDVVEQAQHLASAGYEEIVLAGVHLGHYGLDLDPATDLHGLLDMLLEVVDEKTRLRLSSIDPSEIDPAMVRRLVEDPRLCRYLHLPLQSGSDGVLTRMRRAYDVSTYAELVENIAALDSSFGLGADIIVGFPGETDAEFEETRKLLERLPIPFFHVFRYSDRDRTTAQRMADKVPARVAIERSEILRKLGEAKREAFLRDHVGRVYDAVVEGEGGASDSGTEAMLDDYASVTIPAREDLVQRRVRVRVDAFEDGRLRATLIDSHASACRRSPAEVQR